MVATALREFLGQLAAKSRGERMQPRLLKTGSILVRCSSEFSNYQLFRDDKLLKPLKGIQRYERLLAKLKREGEGYRREFASAS